MQLENVKHLLIEATSYCNIHCPQCPRYDQEGFLNKDLIVGHLDFETFSNNLKLDLLPNLERVQFEGDYGDCLMHPKIDNFINFFSTVPKVVLVTNGTLRSPSWWRKLAQHSNVEVIFSIDGLEHSNHIYRINADWQKIVANVQSYISAGGRATWKYIVFKHNEQDLESAKTFADELGFTNFIIEYTNRSWWSGPQWPVKINGEYQYDIEPSSKHAHTVSLEPHVASLEYFKNQPHAETNFSPSKCWLTRHTMYINSKGHVLPCCMSSSTTWAQTLSAKVWRKMIGNIDSIDITKNTFADILNSEFYQTRLVESWKNKKTIHPLCVSNCG